MTNDALRTILPIAGWGEERARGGRDHRRCRSDLADAVPHRRDQRRRARGGRPRRLRSVGIAHRASPGGRGRYPPGDRLAPQRALHADGRGARVDRAQHGDGRLSGQERALELSPLQFPEPSRRRPQRARRAGRSRGGAQSGGEVGRARARGGDHRREGRRGHGAHHGRMGPAPAGRRHRLAAADGDRQDRRQPAGTASRRRPAVVGRPGARPDTGPGRADLCPHPGRARRRRLEDHRRRTCRISATRNTIPVTASSPPIWICASRRIVETLRGLVREADVFSQGYRPGTLGDRGLSPEALAQLRPGIVFVSLCAFSHVGPWASRRGFDTVVQTVSGITSRQGELFPGAAPGPQFYPVSAIDYLTGYLMAFGAHGGARPPRARGR